LLFLHIIIHLLVTLVSGHLLSFHFYIKIIFICLYFRNEETILVLAFSLLCLNMYVTLTLKLTFTIFIFIDFIIYEISNVLELLE